MKRPDVEAIEARAGAVTVRDGLPRHVPETLALCAYVRSLEDALREIDEEIVGVDPIYLVSRIVNRALGKGTT